MLCCLVQVACAPFVHVGCPLTLLPTRISPSQPQREPHSAPRMMGTAACAGKVLQ